MTIFGIIFLLLLFGVFVVRGCLWLAIVLELLQNLDDLCFGAILGLVSILIAAGLRDDLVFIFLVLLDVIVLIKFDAEPDHRTSTEASQA